MQVNESVLDRVLRAFFGVVVLYFSYTVFSGWLMIIGYIFGVVLVFTAITGFCLAYKLLGISTKK